MRLALDYKIVLLMAFILLPTTKTLLASDVIMSHVTDEVDVYLKEGQVNENWDDYVIKGFKAYANSDFDNARLNLQKAYDAGCRDGFVLFRLTISYAVQDMCQQAIKYGKEAIPYYREQYPKKFKDSSLFQVIGDCSNGNEAIEYYRQGLENNPNDVSARLNRAHELVQLNRIDAAQKEFLAIIEGGRVSSYGFGVAYNGLGRIAKGRGNYRQAIKYYQKAYELRDGGVDAWGIALSYEGLKDYKSARYYWNKAADAYGHNDEWGRQALQRARQLEGY
ncbi:MAG: tetratricopeptide repeat protein [Candidatus Omnitrophica bacterium]|nr:tetratricopeptide repeat protein [Candidatus Omnitrophota bacterium]